MTRTIEVTAELIAEASRADSGHCMIADAIRVAYPECTNISVDLQSIRFSDRSAGKRYIYLTPAYCQQQLLRFDFGTVVKPWSFRLPARAAQAVSIKIGGSSSEGKKPPNKLNRPNSVGPKKITEQAKNYVPTVHGGNAPPFAVLAHSQGAGRHKGRTRIFGLKAAGVPSPENFDPAQGGVD